MEDEAQRNKNAKTGAKRKKKGSEEEDDSMKKITSGVCIFQSESNYLIFYVNFRVTLSRT